MSKTYLTGGQIVLPNQVLLEGYLTIENGIIIDISSEKLPDNIAKDTLLDVEGAYILPGIIDIHTDALDAEIIPRPGADIPIRVAFTELERKMAGVGFTTVFHSLHMGYKQSEFFSRSKYTRHEVFDTVSRAFLDPGLLRNKIHLRYEVSGIEAYDSVKEFIEKGYISLLSVMDHTPGQGQFGKTQFMEMMKKMGKSEEEAIEKFESESQRPRIEGEKLKELIAFAISKGIPVASHDDDSPEKVDLMHSYGVSVCEFPINMETAHHASQLGMHVAGGASNILRGGSLSGNADMKTAVKENAVDVLCSDYYPPSILHSIFKLYQEEGIPLNETTNLATLNAAKASKIDHYTGSLEVGKSADLIVVHMINQLPSVTKTMVEGHWVLTSSPRQKK